MGKTKGEIDLIRSDIFNFLDANGDMTREQLKQRLNPDCSDSMVDGNLKKWRIAKGIPTRTTKPMVDKVRIDSRPQVVRPDPVKTIEDDQDQHNFSCSVKVPMETYKLFKLVSAYKGDSIRFLMSQWMGDYVRDNRAVLKGVFDDMDL